MARKVVLVAGFAGLLLSGSTALAFEPSYNTKMPDLLGKLLESRGASQASIEGTKRGVAAVATAEAASVGATVGRYAWLAAAARSRWLIGGLTLIPLAVDGVYRWYTTDGENFADDPPATGPSPDVVVSDDDLEAFRSNQLSKEVKVAGWKSLHHSCVRGEGYKCAASEYFIKIKQWVDNNRANYTNKDMGAFLYDEFVPVSYTMTCAQNETSFYGVITCSGSLNYTYKMVNKANPAQFQVQNRTQPLGPGLANVVEYYPPEPAPEVKPECVTMGSPSEYCDVAPFYTLPNTVAYPSTEKPQTLPQNEAAKEADHSLLANSLDDLWERAAAMQDYDGEPYPMDQPITQAELTALLNTFPDLRVGLGELAGPIGDPTTGTVPWAPTQPGDGPGTDPDPDPDPGTDPGTNPGTGTDIDMTHPGLGAPELPPIPTIQDIVGPILNDLPDALGGLSIPTSEVCPVFEFQVFEQPFVFEAHCLLLEQNKAMIAALMLALYLTMALLIVLSA